MKKKILGLIMLVFCSGAFASSPGWYGPYNVEMIEVNENRVYFHRPSNLSAFPDFGCTTDYVFLEGEKLPERALAIGLTAQATGKKVKFHLSGCGPFGYIQANGIQSNPAW